MSILNKRVYLINVRRFRRDYFIDKTFTTNFFVAYSAVLFHSICNLSLSSDCKTLVRVIGSYVP